ncbi:MAG TPA: phosphoribosylanthranilate isomerase [Chloroflexota bacterium]|nr:phosphoribosylanthranilate isomerase [Chloroflexota bacterium]
MSALLVKIDGLRDLEHARVAVDAGADFVGFVFARTRRYVAPEVVAAIVAALPDSVKKVGVFVDEAADSVRSIVRDCRLDFAQLCGDESVEYCQALGVPSIKSFRVRGPEVANEVARFDGHVTWNILDGYQENSYGGTGIRFDWQLAQDLTRRFPIFLAGGLTESNVAEAIRIGRPAGVDVSSGVETDGTKDSAKITAFVAAARRAAEGNGY